jgi:hypothetical protein
VEWGLAYTEYKRNEATLILSRAVDQIRPKAAQAALAETSPEAAKAAAGQTWPEEAQSPIEETHPFVADAPVVVLLLVMHMTYIE